MARLRAEIVAETQKPGPDPLTLGAKYAEIGTVCREIAAQSVEVRKRNEALLNDTQRLKLDALQQAAKLVPVISEARQVRLLEPPLVPTASRWFDTTSFILPTTGTEFSRTDGTRLGATGACSLQLF